jgi:hypothetical protein
MVCVLAGFAVDAGDAHAFDNYYCGVLLNSGSWCGDGSNHTYDSTRGDYPGAGSTWVCARLLYADTASERGRHCNTNYGFYNLGTNTTTLYEAEVNHTDGAARHTIYGHGIA